MIDTSTFLKVSELGLAGKKQDLIKCLEEFAAEASNKNKRGLYNGILDLLEKHLVGEVLTFSSSEESPGPLLPVQHLWFPENVSMRVRQFVVLNKKKKLGENLIHTNKLLLYGPPGTGKTTLGIYLAGELNLPIRYVRISDIISSRFGETLKNISQLFDDEKKELIFLDEFDAFAKSRTDSQDIGELKRIVNSIIQTLDFHSAHKVVVVATNLIDTIDPAIIRRFPFKIHLGYLSEAEMMDLFHFLIKNAEAPVFYLTDSEIKSLIKILELKTIDSVKSLFDKTTLLASVNDVSEIRFPDLMEALAFDGYFNKDSLKAMRREGDTSLKKIVLELSKRGYSQEKISKLFGIHRNSFNGFFK